MLRFLFFSVVVQMSLFHVATKGPREYLVEKDQALENTALDRKYVFSSSQQTAVAACFSTCVQHCQCLTFQVCNGTECQLLSANRFIAPSALRSRIGCTYYNMVTRSKNDKTRACTSEIDCCRTSSPCSNGGICTPILSTDNTSRFNCSCPEGFYGTRCEYPAKSCKSVSSSHHVSGKYKILDASMNAYEVFCDFDHNTSISWTLIQSYQLQKQQYVDEPYFVDLPINKDNPNWSIYRLSLSRMESIQQDSSKWRITCNYDTDGTVYKDLVLGSINIVDILSYHKRKCSKVDYINIRGQSCYNCTTFTRQGLPHVQLHFDSNHTYGPRCDFYPTGGVFCHEDNQSEDSFGFYRCTNPAHRCTASNTSTTQTWFGGKLAPDNP